MTKQKSILGVAALSILGVVLVFFVMTQEQGEKIVRVSGAVVSVFDGRPIAGVDLVVGDTSIRTGETGRFVFPEVSTQTGIRLTHPELLRAIVKLPETRANEQEGDILFDLLLYNALISVVDLEARGKVELVYEELASRITERLSREEFRLSFEPLFSKEDITNQGLLARLHSAFRLPFAKRERLKVVHTKTQQWKNQ